jgi:hypothetical protein
VPSTSGPSQLAKGEPKVFETEPNEPPIPNQPTADDKEDYGAKAADDRDPPEKKPKQQDQSALDPD